MKSGGNQGASPNSGRAWPPMPPVITLLVDKLTSVLGVPRTVFAGTFFPTRCVQADRWSLAENKHNGTTRYGYFLLPMGFCHVH